MDMIYCLLWIMQILGRVEVQFKRCNNCNPSPKLYPCFFWSIRHKFYETYLKNTKNKVKILKIQLKKHALIYF